MTEIVILGGGMVAGFAAQEMAENGMDDRHLTIVSADTEAPYHLPPLSKGFLAGEEEAREILINDPGFYDDHGIDLLLETEITVSFDARRRVERRDSAVEQGMLAGRRVVAAFVMDRPDAEREAAEPLIRTGRPVDAGQVADTGITLDTPTEP